MVASQIYDGKTVSALDKWREGANKTMRGNDAISFSLLWLEIAVLRVSKRGLAAVKSTCTAFASCAVKDDIKMWFQNSHTHTIEIVSTHYIFSLNKMGFAQIRNRNLLILPAAGRHLLPANFPIWEQRPPEILLQQKLLRFCPTEVFCSTKL